jgi:hypothetical protein
MSIGNVKSEGNKGINFPWQLKMLQGQQCACDYLKEIDINTDQLEPLLVQILAAVQQGTDYEAAIVVDANDNTWLEIRVWNGVSFDAPIYFEAGNNTTGTPVAPITYINPNTYLAQIVSNTTGLATEGTLANIDSNISLLATESTLTNIESNVFGILTNTSGLATETTLLAVDTKLTAAARTPNVLTDLGVGSTPTGVYSFSIANVGTAAGLVNGQSVPAGVTLNFDGGSLNNTLNSLPYDASGTIFIITWIS